jgi:hypothetical protein
VFLNLNLISTPTYSWDIKSTNKSTLGNQVHEQEHCIFEYNHRRNRCKQY